MVSKKYSKEDNLLAASKTKLLDRFKGHILLGVTHVTGIPIEEVKKKIKKTRGGWSSFLPK